jgi:hypothetical protein
VGALEEILHSDPLSLMEVKEAFTAAAAETGEALQARVLEELIRAVLATLVRI